MSRFLTLSRAARLVGVTRGVLQKRIREGELPSQDGMVSSEDLLRVYPDFDPADNGDFERIVRIKERAVCADYSSAGDSSELAGCDVYLAGPEDFVAAVKVGLAAAGMPLTQLYVTVV